MNRFASYIIDDTIHWLDPAELKPAADNPRVRLKTAYPGAFAALRESIKRGDFKAILVEKSTCEIVGGCQRHDVYTDLKSKCPVIYLRDLTPEEKTRIRIADNGTFGAWDLPQLSIQIDTLPKDDLPLLGLDALTLDLVAPNDQNAQDDHRDDESQTWATLKFKMAKEAAEIVDDIIGGFCKRERCKPGTALERIVVEWGQSDNSLAA